jgi:hypothetical protein
MGIRSERRRWTMLAIGLSIACFTASLFLPALILGGGRNDSYSGLSLFIMGPLGPLDAVFAWYANPFLPLMYVLLWKRRYRWVLWSEVVCLGLALTTLWMGRIPLDERPTYGLICSYGPGFYLWLTSLAIPGVAALLWSCAILRQRVVAATLVDACDGKSSEEGCEVKGR